MFFIEAPRSAQNLAWGANEAISNDPVNLDRVLRIAKDRSTVWVGSSGRRRESVWIYAHVPTTNPKTVINVWRIAFVHGHEDDNTYWSFHTKKECDDAYIHLMARIGEGWSDGL